MCLIFSYSFLSISFWGWGGVGLVVVLLRQNLVYLRLGLTLICRPGFFSSFYTLGPQAPSSVSYINPCFSTMVYPKIYPRIKAEDRYFSSLKFQQFCFIWYLEMKTWIHFPIPLSLSTSLKPRKEITKSWTSSWVFEAHGGFICTP